jgi:hypothetical protein
MGRIRKMHYRKMEYIAANETRWVPMFDQQARKIKAKTKVFVVKKLFATGHIPLIPSLHLFKGWRPVLLTRSGGLSEHS